MKLIIKELIRKGISSKYILYISLDDYLFHQNSIIEIINEYRKLHKLKVEEKIYLFLDEVTYKDNFHIQLKNIYDSQNTKIFAASSSASMLRDKKASLTGILYICSLDGGKPIKNCYLQKKYMLPILVSNIFLWETEISVAILKITFIWYYAIKKYYITYMRILLK